MTDDHEGHGDATLDVIALLEAAVKDDGHAYDVLMDGIVASKHLPHVIGTMAGIVADQLTSHHGRDGALEFLAHQRGHELGSPGHECGHGEPSPLGAPETMGDAADRIADEVSELGNGIAVQAEQISGNISDLAESTAENTDELRALTRAVDRLGDILDKRLS